MLVSTKASTRSSRVSTSQSESSTADHQHEHFPMPSAAFSPSRGQTPPNHNSNSPNTTLGAAPYRSLGTSNHLHDHLHSPIQVRMISDWPATLSPNMTTIKNSNSRSSSPFMNTLKTVTSAATSSASSVNSSYHNNPNHHSRSRRYDQDAVLSYPEEMDLTIPVSLRKNTANQGMTRISNEDRSHLDPFVRRKEWYESYRDRKQGQVKNKQAVQEYVQDRHDQKTLAKEERKKIREFEHHLVLGKYAARETKYNQLE